MLLLKVRKNSFKALAAVILFGLSAYLNNRCEEEKPQTRSYPRVKTNPVSNITDKGATFNAEIYSPGTELMTDHGFVWGEGNLTDNNVRLGSASPAGAFSAEIVTSLGKDVEYTVKAFIQTTEHVVYGLPVTFKSLGSGAPVVTGFAPHSAAWLDTVRITGKNFFSYEVSRNRVKLNQALCTVITATDTLLIIEVSPLVSELQNLVSVEIEGNISVYTKESLTFIGPELNDFIPKKAFWGDTLYLKGKHLKSFTSNADNSVKLGTFKCERVGQITDTAVSVRVTSELSYLRSELNMKINSINLNANEQFELLQPYFSIAPKSGTWGTTITLTGRFNNVASRNAIHFHSNGYDAPVRPEDILSTTLSAIKFKVPDYQSAIESIIIYEADPFTSSSIDTFHLSAPVINSFSPVSGPGGTLVTIKGKNFDIIDPAVMFGNISAQCGAINDSVLIATVPVDVSGDVKISVKAKLQLAVSSEYFLVTNPKITQVSPLSGTFNDEITITGESFVSPRVTFDGIPATVKSSTETTIVVLVPLTIDSIPRVLTVVSGINSTSSTQKFTLLPPQIFSESPEVPVAGADITITGNGFNPSTELNTVLLDIYPMTIKSSSGTEIVATLPVSIPRGNFGIKVIAGGYTRSTTQNFNFDSQWLRIEAPSIPSTYPYGYYEGMSLYAKSIGNLAYIYSEVSNETYEFDPSDRTFTKLSVSSPYDGSIHMQMAEVVCKDTFYLISGIYNGNKMWAFNERNIGWRQVPLSASINNQAGVAFSLNDKIYFGLNYNNASVWFFECDPANNYAWIRKSDFPTEPPVPYSSYFSVGNKGYVVFSDNSLWQYDPGIEQWTRKADFPGPGRKLTFSFAMAGKVYIGAGDSMHEYTDYDGLWMYDPVADTWALVSRMPMSRNSAIAFTIGNKAYIGFGLKRTGSFPQSLFDFYEFDPNYPAK